MLTSLPDQSSLHTQPNVSVPQFVDGLADRVTVVDASEATCVVLEEGTVQCWDTLFNPTPKAVVLAVQVLGNVISGGGSLVISGNDGVGRIQQNTVFASESTAFSLSCPACRATIDGNGFIGSKGAGISLNCSARQMKVVTNTITSNQGVGIQFNNASSNTLVMHNNLVNNGLYEIYLANGEPGTQNFTLDAANNFWNVSEASIPGRIRDCTFDENGCGTANATVGKVAYPPPLAAPEQAAPAFATALALQPDTVGVERGTLAVEFSKPMDTAILPAAHFQQAADQPQFAFENGQWVSSTRFEASYDFTALVALGYYTVTVEGAVGSDGMPAYAAKADAFRVDFGSGVSLDLPAAPAVRAQTDGALSNLSAAWQTSSSSVDQYRYAIGTAPNARDVVGWTYLAANNFTRNDLNLVKGQRYYVIVQAHNTVGLWSADGVSNAVIGGAQPSVYLPLISR